MMSLLYIWKIPKIEGCFDRRELSYKKYDFINFTYEADIRIGALPYRRREYLMNNELLTIFVGIIAMCMVFITVVVVVIGLQVFNTMKRLHEFVDSVQSELSFLSTKAALTLHEVNELIGNLKAETRSLGGKSLAALHELHELIGYFHNQAKLLTLKASNGIVKVTLGSLVIGALSQFFKKNQTK